MLQFPRRLDLQVQIPVLLGAPHPDSGQLQSHPGACASHHHPLAPQPLPVSLTHLPVIIAEIRTQGVEIQGEPQSAAHQLCNHLSTAFPPAWLPARAQQRQQKTEASIPTFRRLHLLAALFPGFPARLLALPPLLLPIPDSSPPSPPSAGALPLLRVPGVAGSHRAPHARHPREASGDPASRPPAENRG